MLGRPISDLALGEENSDADLSILTLAELYEAAGLEEDSDGTHDEELTALGNSVAMIIANFCLARAADGSIPTLMMENLVETFLLDAPITALVLARRPVQEVASVSVSDNTLAETDYTVLKGSGIIRRVNRGSWCGEVVVTYTAGFVSAPDALKYAAKALVRDIRSASAASSDSSSTQGAVRAITVEGVGSVQYAVDSTSIIAERGLLPTWMADLLAPYVNSVI